MYFIRSRRKYNGSAITISAVRVDETSDEDREE